MKERGRRGDGRDSVSMKAARKGSELAIWRNSGVSVKFAWRVKRNDH